MLEDSFVALVFLYHCINKGEVPGGKDEVLTVEETEGREGRVSGRGFHIKLYLPLL